MRMLRWMCNKSRKNRICNEQIQEKVKVTPIVEKIRELLEMVRARMALASPLSTLELGCQPQ